MVDRCICYGKTFAELKDIAERESARTVPELQKAAEFGRQCGMCRQYVQRMLDTGKTRFPVMPPSMPE